MLLNWARVSCHISYFPLQFLVTGHSKNSDVQLKLILRAVGYYSFFNYCHQKKEIIDTYVLLFC